jgi:uncharacterized protein YoxC
MTNFSGASLEEQVFKKIDENSKNIKDIKADVKKIKRYMFIRNILGIVYMIIVIAPIILGVIFLPKIIESFTQGYLNQVMPGSVPENLGDIFKSYKEILK